MKKVVKFHEKPRGVCDLHILLHVTENHNKEANFQRK